VTRLRDALFRPVDIAWLPVFRIAFGVLIFEEALRYLLGGLGRNLYIRPPFHFTYEGFGWVQPWPGIGIYVHFAALALLAAFVALGLFYRVAAPLLALAFTYVFLLDQARYLNHFYLVVILGWILAILPAGRALSLDARMRPALRSAAAPAWTLWLVRGQIAVVYVYAGIAKLNLDWLRGEPLRMWLAERSDLPLFGEFLTEDWVPFAMSYGALVLDLFCVPLLLWRRTRALAFALLVLFHALNVLLFDIGIFPWLMLAATLVFLEPDWPRAFARRLRGTRHEVAPSPSDRAPLVASTSTRRGLILAALAAHFAIQLVVPLRHLLYPGDVNWTEEGHRFSWRMKLRGKDGWVAFSIREPRSGRVWAIDPSAPPADWGLDVSGDEWPSDVPYLTPRQVRKMAGLPDMVLQFAHHIAERFERAGYPGVEVRARVLTSLNGRKHQLLIDPEVDLAAEPRSLLPAHWILPLREPLRRDG